MFAAMTRSENMCLQLPLYLYRLYIRVMKKLEPVPADIEWETGCMKLIKLKMAIKAKLIASTLLE